MFVCLFVFFLLFFLVDYSYWLVVPNHDPWDEGNKAIWQSTVSYQQAISHIFLKFVFFSSSSIVMHTAYHIPLHSDTRHTHVCTHNIGDIEWPFKHNFTCLFSLWGQNQFVCPLYSMFVCHFEMDCWNFRGMGQALYWLTFNRVRLSNKSMSKRTNKLDDRSIET